MLTADLARDLCWGLDPAAFAVEGLNFTPDPWQAQALRWEGRRLLLNVCRQAGKSTTAAVLGLHTALYHPGALVLLVSPSLRQSSELFRKVADHLEALKVKPALLEDNRLSLQLANRSRIVSLPSTEATVRGFSGATLIIEDEASRVNDELHQAVRPMLAVSGGRLILMSTPWGKRGHFFQAWSEGTEYERIQIKAPECARIPALFLEEEGRAMPPWVFAQEYMCSFEDAEDSVFTHGFIEALHDDSIQPLFIAKEHP